MNTGVLAKAGTPLGGGSVWLSNGHKLRISYIRLYDAAESMPWNPIDPPLSKLAELVKLDSWLVFAMRGVLV